MYQEIEFSILDPVAEIRHALAAAEDDEPVVGMVLTGAGRGFAAVWI